MLGVTAKMAERRFVDWHLTVRLGKYLRQKVKGGSIDKKDVIGTKELVGNYG